MKYFSMFSGIGGFELGIQNAYRSTQRGEQTDTQGNQGQGLLTSEGQGTSPKDGRSGERSTDWSNERPLCIGYSEIDKYAIKVYERHFNGHRNYGDATAIDPRGLPRFDLLVGGFPCQAFSIAGKRLGFSETRGTLFFEIARILADKRPGHLVLENVKGLLSHDQGKTFQTILGVLADLGYRVEWQVLNSKDFGVPQNRERIYIVGHLGDGSCGQVFPIRQTDSKDNDRRISAAGINNPSRGFEIRRDGLASSLRATEMGSKNIIGITQLNQPKHSNDRVYGTDGVSPTLNTMQGGNRQPFIASKLIAYGTSQDQKLNPLDGVSQTLSSGHYNQPKIAVKEATKTGYAIAIEGDSINLSQPNSKTRRGRVGKGVANTLETSQTQATLEGTRIRRLTPKECERLQGFPDDWTALGVLRKWDDWKNQIDYEQISDTQRYKMCGNAVTTNVVQAVIEGLKPCLTD